jgi:hypothetical protein
MVKHATIKTIAPLIIVQWTDISAPLGYRHARTLRLANCRLVTLQILVTIAFYGPRHFEDLTQI